MVEVVFILWMLNPSAGFLPVQFKTKEACHRAASDFNKQAVGWLDLQHRCIAIVKD